MSTDPALIEKREELKRRLAAGEYKTLVDIFLEWCDRSIRKVTRRSKPLPIWLIIVFLVFIINLIVFAEDYVEGDITAVANLLRLEYRFVIPLMIWITAIATIAFVILNLYVHKLFSLWHDVVLDAMKSLVSLREFEGWLEQVSNWRFHFLLMVVTGSLAFTFTVIPISYELGSFAGFGFAFASIILNVFAGSFVYQIILVGFLAAKLRRYDLELFPLDPASSELVHDISTAFNSVIYFIGIIAALLTLPSAFSKLLPSFNIFLALSYWPAIITIFILTQASLSIAVQRAKRNTLKEVQTKIERLRASKSFGSPKIMDTISKLMDYHDRVKATRESALDIKAYFSLINSLILPLLAFVLGNLELVLKLFGITP